jgi:hypothetical protein
MGVFCLYYSLRRGFTALVLMFVLAVALAPHVDERPSQPGAHGYTNMLINGVDKASSILFYISKF